MLTTAYRQAPYFIFHAPGKGAIARYHLDTAVIESQLSNLRDSGADGISLSLWLMKDVVKLGMSDTFLDWNGGQLTTQMQFNLTEIFASLKSHGFNWVQIVPQFYGPNDFRQWPSWNETLYLENKNFLFGLPDLLNQAGLPYLIDLCAEVTNGPYPQRLWIDWTCWFWPDGVPCWDATMSFLPDPASIAALPSVFSGNYPVILAPHIYGYDPQKVFDSVNAAGLGGRPWILGEDYSLAPTDTAFAAARRQFIATTKQPIMRVCPWPVTLRTPVGTQIDSACVPAIFSQPWAAVGA
jgi:hypothetical protein